MRPGVGGPTGGVMFESLFEFLFKYRPLLFEQGVVRWATEWPWIWAAVALAGAGLAAFTYRSVGGKTNRTDRAALTALRTLALLGLAALLFRPTLLLSRTLPQQNFVAVLVDDSRSMALTGAAEERATFALQQLSADPSSIASQLGERFAVRTFRFAETTQRVDSLGEVTFEGTRTDLAGALDRVRRELEGVPLAGVVVLTDGADNSGDAVTDALLPYRADGIPIFTVGLGEEEMRPDIQVSRVEAPRRALEGGAVVVDVVIDHSGYTGRTVSVLVEDDGIVISAEDVELGVSGQPITVPLHIRTEDPGPRTLVVRVPAQDDEAIIENNRREVLITVEEGPEKILYFEGEPRYEVSFLRRAVQGDPNVQLVILQRTAEDKFLPLNVDDETELSGGFPTTREELFRYRALILGSIEASFFSHDQLQMIADFVSERGGGLLVLGGRRALAEGGYQGTPLEDVLPVELDDPLAAPRLVAELAPQPTRAGLDHPVLRIGTDASLSAERWGSLPTLSSFNRLTRLKAGATSLLTATDVEGDRILLAHHRFGRGRAMAFPVNDTWVWQMDPNVPLEDATHELFWRQLLRWLVEATPAPVRIDLAGDRVDPDGNLMVRAQVEDSAYLAVNGATVRLELINPTGDTTSTRLDWNVDRDGEYEGSVAINGTGLQRIRVTAERDGAIIGEHDAFVRSEPSDEEFFDAGMRAPLLKRIAEETGGQFYTADDVETLPEDVQYTGAGVTVTEERDLWDMPALFILLLMALGGEWAYRRIRGLA
jgi:uncharacterized membrane protein